MATVASCVGLGGSERVEGSAHQSHMHLGGWGVGNLELSLLVDCVSAGCQTTRN